MVQFVLLSPKRIYHTLYFYVLEHAFHAFCKIVFILIFPYHVGKRVRDATLLSIFQFFTFAARI